VSYRVQLTPTARRSLPRLPLAVAAAAVEFIYGPLAASPHQVGKALRPPFDGQLSARRGDYRIRYRLVGDDVQILQIGHRSDVYRPI
jgi:mRNA interferase RelE/StbE